MNSKTELNKEGDAQKALLIVPLSYGYIHSRDILPAVEERALDAAARLYFEHSSEERRIAMGFAVNCPKELPKKIAYLTNLGVQEKHILASPTPLSNIITEGQTIRGVVIINDIIADTVILVVHGDCLMRARYIFSKLFPGSKIVVEKIVGEFEKDIPYKLMRNKFIHRAANFIYYCGIRILGLERMKRYSHPEHGDKQ